MNSMVRAEKKAIVITLSPRLRVCSVCVSGGVHAVPSTLGLRSVSDTKRFFAVVSGLCPQALRLLSPILPLYQLPVTHRVIHAHTLAHRQIEMGAR